MLRLIPPFLIICATILPVQAQQTPGPQPLASALDAAQGRDWDRAAQLAARAGGQVSADIVEWIRLRAGQGTAEEVTGFLNRRADWPGLKLLRKRSEEVMAQAKPAEVIAFFDGAAPQTGTGLLAYAKALSDAGRQGEAEAGVVLGWRTLSLTKEEHAALLAAYPKLLAPHHEARLDMVLWRDWSSNVADMLPLVPDGWRKLATARLGLRAQRKNVDALIAAIPEELAGDPGLAYERFRWRMKKGRTDEAIELLLESSTSAAKLGAPDQWAGWRRSLAREKMRAGKMQTAYALASAHGLVEGSDYADLEWLSGFIALRFLNDPDLARDHFQRFRAAVDTPISLGRAGYWLGRAQEAASDAEAAQAAYAEGAKYQSSFYGLLAAEKAGIGFDATLAGGDAFPDWRQAGFANSSVFEAAMLLLRAGEVNLSVRFLRHLAETLSPTELGQLGDLLDEMQQPHLAVMVGKQAARRGLVIAQPYYALHPMRDMTLPVPMELSLAIARRESEFNFRVVSGAGAQGLMQLMPATAKLVARDLGLDHDPDKVLSDWRYNARLGSAYLASLGQRFDGNILMVAAGYNAGPGRPERWMDLYGDPRAGAVDVIDWIEFIPFRETRNYVMRVAESLPVYRARLGRDPLPQPFSKELTGSSVLPLSP
ncbi:lytic transglycosylase domain-containing protein [Thalassovita aquimarina]|uniref:Lytic transglycosylase domain-containing protein n=2 Tax=Thalassovita aquimarina TaxID=2785917 RepID=A0ABS5HML8_9RHOB|nr:lytic transglycosylase domain-containing protein [Thalassovita aquimarina]MBR9650164.1 lytic transglycosylase domain-containing protein [Thalassovita aquimarina]